MRPKLFLAAVTAAGLALPLAARAADATADLRHIAVMLATQAHEEAFDRLDTKQNGYIDRLEAAQSAQVEADFDRIDTDGDGRISRAEWLAFAAGSS